MNVSWARSSASAWLPAVSLRSVARTADWWRRTSSENACRSSWTTTRAISWASVTSRSAIRVAGSRAASRPGRRGSRRGGAGGATLRRELPLLEPPEDDVADADEQEHEAEPVRRAVVEHRIEREPEADAAQDHALAQVGPGGALPDLPRLLVDRRGRRRCRERSGRVAGERAQRLGRRHDALLGELQHRLVQHPRLAHPVPQDQRDREHRREEHDRHDQEDEEREPRLGVSEIVEGIVLAVVA